MTVWAGSKTAMVCRNSLLVSGMILSGSVLGAELPDESCVVSNVQPETIDLDKPRDQLARQSDLVIPAYYPASDFRYHRPKAGQFPVPHA
jgi:hypothetical protein